ncbi:phage late control D family protein [Sporosarcina sp. FSL K6-5500]|uniref:phage late control D family protein n=1 Tax=Sporosarcina sp. FSL K6-5500 TaxID=2921558 RepID=UPI0030F7FCE2
MKVRRVRTILKYNGVNISKSLEGFLTHFTYADNEGAGDDIQISLQDRDGKWHGDWLMKKGDVITAVIETENWLKEGEKKRLDCGSFHVDTIDFKGPPDTLTIKALSIPYKDGGKNSKRSRVWEKATFSTIAGDIAASAGLTLLYDAPDYLYDRVDQIRETDLAFLKKRAKKEGISVKVTKEQLVLYDEQSYESKSSVRTIKRGESDITGYSFTLAAADKEYKKVQISYFDSSKKKNLKYVYDVPKVEKGPTLKLNERAKSLAEAIRWAKKAVRNKNKQAKTGKLTLIGDTTLVQGMTINIEGFKAFDGKYFIESTSHVTNNGYVVSISIREVLSY